MAVPEYSKARRMAQKAYRQDMAARRNPYLQVLDEILPMWNTVGETDLGLVEIPISQIVGTKTVGRTRAFAGNFMPLLPENSEFAEKWSALYRSHLEEGIREPVIACEFLNCYYIIEGNKRVSVLKFSGAVSLPGYVTRIIPAPGDSPELKIYYEYMDFYKASRINSIYFSREGSFDRLCRLLGKEPGEAWNEDERRAFTSAFFRFSEIYEEKGGEKLPVTPGDGFLLYLNIYGFDGMLDKSMDRLRREVSLLWPDLEALASAGSVRLITRPGEEDSGASLVKKLIVQPAESSSALLGKILPSARPRLTVGFIHYGTIYTSGWTYAHDLGRLYLEESLKGQVSVKVYDGLKNTEDGLAAIEQAVREGCQVIFTTSARFLEASIRACIRHPEIRILNCSLNTYSGHLRTYYGRLYEAKFLVGLLAGILSDSGRIGYIADFPFPGSTASINAFSLGVQMVCPDAKVLLAWSTEKEGNPQKRLVEAGVDLIAGADMLAPSHSPRPYGLYRPKGECGGVNLASSIWHWGKFYQRILQTILNGNWGRTASEISGDSINYWWGLSSGLIDVIVSKSVPARSVQLMEMVKNQIINESFHIFSGDIRDQQNVLRTPGGIPLSPPQIVRMDWLAANVEGRMPRPEDLTEEAAQMMAAQEIFLGKEGSL